jgi:hypothetical protein
MDGSDAGAGTDGGETSLRPDLLERMDAAFQEALAASAFPVTIERYRFAGRAVGMRVLGGVLGERTRRAFAHLVDPSDPEAGGFRIDLWDERETGVPLPSYAEPGPQWIACGGTLGVSPEGRCVSFRFADSITVLDRLDQRMIGCRRNGSYLSGGEFSKPLQLLLSVWLYDRGVQLVHAGLLSREGHGILLPGESGSGKSTTSLAAALQGLDFLGDDFVGIERDGGVFLGHSVYSTACLTAANLERFPELGPLAVKSTAAQEEKPILFLSEICPQRLPPTARVRAVALPRIRQDRTEIRRATRAEALRQLAASTLHTVVPRPGREALQMLGELVESVPAYWVNLGPDLGDIGPVMDQILASACATDDA